METNKKQGAGLSERFIDEDLADHHIVDESSDSFLRLHEYLTIQTNFRPYFEKALTTVEAGCNFNNSVILDIGAGTGWTSGILASRYKGSTVYAIEPSEERAKSILHIARHFGVPDDNIKVIDGTFADFGIEAKADLIVLCGSFHHCWGHDIPVLFKNIFNNLKPTGQVLIVNEHYVRWAWSFRRLLSWAKNLLKGRLMYYYPGNLNAPDPFDGEHWRTRSEISSIFFKNGFDCKMIPFEGDLCLDKPRWIDTWGWTYYYAILTPKEKSRIDD